MEGQMGRDGNEEISSRATWDQGGRILSQQGGFQVSKGDSEGGQKETQQGEKKARGSANVYKPSVCIIIACKYQNDCQSYVCR
jgi:hypothetical protein